MSKLVDAPGEGGDDWLPIADLMAGLMMVFLLIALLYIQNVSEAVGSWRDIKYEIKQALEEEFKNEKKYWQMDDIDEDTLTIRFLHPEVLFGLGETEITTHYQGILDDFFPRYINLIHEEFKQHIHEIRIEGHTSLEWGNLKYMPAFINNMRLSQNRAQAVMEYCLKTVSNHSQGIKEWITYTISANGHSSSQRKILRDANVVTIKEDKESSRRVEFSIRTKTEEILKSLP